jgi:hypothetical protein
MQTATKPYQVGDRFTSTKVIDGGFKQGGSKITLLDGEVYTVKEVLPDFIVAEGLVHIQQEGRYPVDTFVNTEFVYS